MPRTWVMRKVVSFTEKEVHYEGRTWWRKYFIMECGHKRHYATEFHFGTRYNHYGPGCKQVNDKARCYECGKTKNQLQLPIAL